MAEDRQKKIAVIGATGYNLNSDEGRVECFPWNQLTKATNLADYDVLIINLLSLDNAEDIDSEDFLKALDISTVGQILGRPNGEIYVLGDPRFNLQYNYSNPFSETLSTSMLPFLHWTGFKFTWDSRPGDTVERRIDATRGPFKPFADKLKRWEYSLVGCELDYSAIIEGWDLRDVISEGASLTAAVEPICHNRYGNELMFSVRLAMEDAPDRYARYTNPNIVPLSHPIYFLPETELSEEQTLELVLRDLCGVNVSAPEPKWIAEFVAPGQEEIDRELSQLNARIDELIEQFNGKIEKREEIRKPLKLLYESGDALEETVWSVLEGLGANVAKPTERGKEDGWLAVDVGDETFEGVLEIKGVKSKHFNLEGLRQLTDWIERGRTFYRKTYTGIFVGNSSREDPPRRRLWPFNNNWVEQAEMRGYAAIRTEDLYIIYLLDRTDRLDRENFWHALFSTKGPFNIRPYQDQLTDEEKSQLENLS